jgi:hypothetical protein
MRAVWAAAAENFVSETTEEKIQPEPPYVVRVQFVVSHMSMLFCSLEVARAGFAPRPKSKYDRVIGV